MNAPTRRELAYARNYKRKAEDDAKPVNVQEGEYFSLVMLVIWTVSLRALPCILPSPTMSTINSHNWGGESECETACCSQNYPSLHRAALSRSLPNEHACFACLSTLPYSQWSLRKRLSHSYKEAPELASHQFTTLVLRFVESRHRQVQEQTTTIRKHWLLAINFTQNILIFPSLKRNSCKRGRHICSTY